MLLSVSCSQNAGTQAQEPLFTMASPDGNLTMGFYMTPEGTPQYSLDFQGRPVVLPSSLGYELRGNLKAQKVVVAPDKVTKEDRDPSYMFNTGFEVLSVDNESVDETWTPVWGEESSIRNNYNEMTVELAQGDKRLVLRFRLFDDGLGFRYEFPEQPSLTYFVIKEELTEFRMAGDHTAYWIPGDFDTQEYQYTECRLSEIAGRFEAALCPNDSQTPFSPNGVQTSLQMKSDDGLYINIHEAALENYGAMHLLLDPKTLTFTSFITPEAIPWRY